MRVDWKIATIPVLILMVLCAKPKSKWLKWQESLDLASPNALSFKINMQRKIFHEGEPLVFRMFIINKIDIPQTIVAHNRTSMIEGGLQTYRVVTELDSVFMYCPYVHANLGLRPENAIVLQPYDTLYFYAILCPDMFRQKGFPMGIGSMPPGNYIIESNIHLGTKFYPEPGRTLNVTSHPTMFSIESLPAKEGNYLSKIRPYMKNFFGHNEGYIFPEENDFEVFMDSAFFWLDQIRNTNSYFTPYADFIYTCISAARRTREDTLKLDNSISEARKFIDKYNGSILVEEMEFKLAWWLFLKDSTGIEFCEHAKKVIEKYPKNINSFGIRKHIPGGL